MKKIVSGLLLLILFLTNVSPAAAAIECNFSQMPSGNLGACVGGFDTRAEVSNYQLNFACEGDAIKCGIGIGTPPQTHRLGEPIAQDPATGKYYSCVDGGGPSQAVIDNYDRCIKRGPLSSCIVGVVAASTAVVLLTPASLAVTIPVAIGACGVSAIDTAAKEAALQECNETFKGDVVPVGGGSSVCSLKYVISGKEITDAAANQNVIFNLCNQIPASQTQRKADCVACADPTKHGVWTAIGCINYTPQGIIGTIVKVGLGIAGGVALLMILAASFLFSTSQGDPKRTTQARDLLTSAVIGLLFIIFSITILQFLGVSVLRIPDFAI